MRLQDLEVIPRAGPEGERVSGSPLKNHKNKGFLSNVGPYPV